MKTKEQIINVPHTVTINPCHVMSEEDANKMAEKIRNTKPVKSEVLKLNLIAYGRIHE